MDKRNDLINEHMGLIKSVVLNYADGSDTDRWDDLFGAAMLGAAMAVGSFDESKEATIATHVRNCCRNAIIDELRKMKRWDNEVPSSHMLVEDEEEQAELDYIASQEDAMWQEAPSNPEDELLRKEELAIAQARVAHIIHTLTEREQYVLFNHVLEEEPETLRAIAEQFKCSKDSILRDKQRLLKTLRIDGEVL